MKDFSLKLRGWWMTRHFLDSHWNFQLFFLNSLDNLVFSLIFIGISIYNVNQSSISANWFALNRLLIDSNLHFTMKWKAVTMVCYFLRQKQGTQSFPTKFNSGISFEFLFFSIPKKKYLSNRNVEQIKLKSVLPRR